MKPRAAELPRLIAVLHLPALPGSPRADRKFPGRVIDRVTERAITEAKLLERAGFDGLMIENFGDAPFYKDQVPTETIAAMSAIARGVVESVRIPLGINVLRNDGDAALSIAAIVGARYIRVNVLSGVVASDQGLIEGQAAELLRKREALGANVAILADAHVKHARSLSSEDIGLAVEELGQRALADAVIVTGATTGRAIAAPTLHRASEAARAIHAPLYVGSGSTPENIAETLSWADGVIVSSTLRKGGQPGAALDPERIKVFIRSARSVGARRRNRG